MRYILRYAFNSSTCIQFFLDSIQFSLDMTLDHLHNVTFRCTRRGDPAPPTKLSCHRTPHIKQPKRTDSLKERLGDVKSVDLVGLGHDGVLGLDVAFRHGAAWCNVSGEERGGRRLSESRGIGETGQVSGAVIQAQCRVKGSVGRLLAAGAQGEAAGDKLGEQVSVKVELRRVIGVIVHRGLRQQTAGNDGSKSSSKESSQRASGFLSCCYCYCSFAGPIAARRSTAGPLDYRTILPLVSRARCGDMEYDELSLAILDPLRLGSTADHYQRGLTWPAPFLRITGLP